MQQGFHHIRSVVKAQPVGESMQVSQLGLG